MTNEVNKNRRSLILLLLVFVVPIILAKLALDYKWFNYGVTNQGRLLEQQLTLNDIGLSSQQGKQWLIIYPLPDDCAKTCQLTLQGIENSYFALGRETPRVTPVAVTLSPFHAEQLKAVNRNHWQLISELNEAASGKNVTSEKIYIADPLGNIVLTYPQPQKASEVITFGKAMLSDLKKLLKYSRIG